MAELEERLGALCQTAALLLLRQPERGEEMEREIADIFRVTPSAVHDLIRQQVERLTKVERQAPVQHA